MVLVGVTTRLALVASTVLACDRCGTEATHRLFRLRTWFVLLLVPVVPFGHGRYASQCSSCGSQAPLARLAVERLAAEPLAVEPLAEDASARDGAG